MTWMTDVNAQKTSVLVNQNLHHQDVCYQSQSTRRTNHRSVQLYAKLIETWIVGHLSQLSQMHQELVAQEEQLIAGTNTVPSVPT